MKKKNMSFSRFVQVKEKYSNQNATPEDFKELEKIYDYWIERHNNMKTKEEFYEMREKLNKIHFNNQVQPYLLVYSKRDKLLTESQKNSDYYKNGKLNTIFNVNS